MDYIIVDDASNRAKAESTDEVIEKLLNYLQETADILTPGTAIKRTLAGIRRRINNGSISSIEIEDLNLLHGLNKGSWQEQTERTHTLACIFAAIAQIHLEKNEATSAMMAILQAGTFNGLARGFSHHRKTNDLNKARKGGRAKASNHQEKIEKLLELLVHHQPAKGWPDTSSTAKALSPSYKKFLSEALNLPADSDENIQKEILKLIESNKTLRETYISHTTPRDLPAE